MKQDKISQNIRTKDDRPSPYDSLGLIMGAIWNPLGSLWGHEVSLGPIDHLWTTYRPPKANFGHTSAPSAIQWLPKGTIGP